MGKMRPKDGLPAYGNGFPGMGQTCYIPSPVRNSDAEYGHILIQEYPDVEYAMLCYAMRCLGAFAIENSKSEAKVLLDAQSRESRTCKKCLDAH